MWWVSLKFRRLLGLDRVQSNILQPDVVITSFGNDDMGRYITMMSIANISMEYMASKFTEVSDTIKDMSYRGCIQLDDRKRVIIPYHVLRLAVIKFGIDIQIPSVTSHMLWQEFEVVRPPLKLIR